MLQQNSNRSTTHLARFLAATVLIGGIAASLFASRVSHSRHEQEVRRVFEAECVSMRNMVMRQIDQFFDVLDSIGQLHDLSDQISERDFAEFTAKGMSFQKKILGGYGFAQRMPHELRSVAESGDGSGFQLLEADSSGAFKPASFRPEYFPLVYQFPSDALGFPTGADLASLPGMPESINAMAQHAGPALARTIRLQSPEGSTGYIALSPLYQAGGTPMLSGFTISVLWPQQILERALSDFATRDVLVRFYDPTMHQTPAGGTEPGSIEYSEAIAVADATWRFEARPSAEYLAARTSALPSLILASGGSITLLLSMTIGLIAGRTRRIEKAVAERTRELKDANKLLSEAMHERMRLESEILEIGEREKQMVGQDLHDSLGQKLTGAVFLSRALATHLKSGDLEAGAQATRINEILKESVAQVRRMARGLSPVDLGEDGLGGALQRLADEISSVYGITCILHHAEELPAPSSKTAHHLYAVAMEAVNNAVRHGQSKEIVIEWSRYDGQGRISVEDDGVGFNPDSTQRGGMGLRIMKYRAAMIGGHFDVTRRPSGGMHVICTYPMNANSEIGTADFADVRR